MATVFEFDKGSHPKVTHIRMRKVIFDNGSCSIEYEEGYMDDEFKPLGCASMALNDDDYAQAISDLNESTNIEKTIEDFMLYRLNNPIVQTPDEPEEDEEEMLWQKYK